MKQHTLTQGSPEWHAHRARHFNASDAPAMLGCSPYMTRSQLLHALHTGLRPEAGAQQQRRFDDGHRFEALARPLAEEIIGEDLYPVVGTEGELSASFDGLTLTENTAFEHKSLNDDLRAVLVEGCSGADLPKHYRVQMEQQLLVSGAEQVLFMASKWDGDTLVEERHCWYTSDPALRAEIVAGWKQFAQDLASYKPAEVVPAAVAAPLESLPAVSVQVQGALAVVSNLDRFGVALRGFIAKIPAKPATDQEFAETEAACKALKRAEESLASAQAGALAQISSVEEMTRMVGDLQELARTTRLASEKLVEARKAAIRAEQVQRGKDALQAHLQALNTRLGKPYMPAVPADFAAAIKGKKTVASLIEAVDVELARAKIAANEIADRIQVNLATLRELATAHAFLFADTPQLVLKAADDCRAVITARIAEHQLAEQRRIEAERERIRAEEAARLQREQEARAAEERRQQEAAARAEQERKTAEQNAAAASAMQAISEAREAESLPAPVLDAVEQAATNLIADMAIGRAAAPAVIPMPRHAAAPASPPTLRLGQITARLGITITADFLAELGFAPAATDKAAKLFHESDFPRMCLAIEQHVAGIRAKHERLAA